MRLFVAALILALWGLGLFFLLGVAGSPALWWPAAVLTQTFLYTGLFITAHEAMHRNITDARWLNDAIGQLCVGLYALFSFRSLREKHHRHHRHPASSLDPDYHDGEHLSPRRWYLSFMLRYVSVWQVVGMASLFNIGDHLLGLSTLNLIVFWVTPSLLSTLQLFYFGTYLPHRGPDEAFTDEHRARSSEGAVWSSFVSCYHFGGYHHEHHKDPSVPWFRLPSRGR